MRSLVCTLAAAGLIAGCGGPSAQVANEPPVESETLTYVEFDVDDAMRQACAEYTMPDPNFAFDSAKLRPIDKAALSGLATCLTGPLDEVTVRLVGQADPRGTDAYNVDLGMRRAESVRDLLVENGVPASRVIVSSIGEAGASKNPPWYNDRKVAVRGVGTSPLGAAGGAAEGRLVQVTMFGEGPGGSLLVFDEREDIDGDGAEEPALYYEARSGDFRRVEFDETGDPDNDGADEPEAPAGRG